MADEENYLEHCLNVIEDYIENVISEIGMAHDENSWRTLYERDGRDGLRIPLIEDLNKALLFLRKILEAYIRGIEEFSSREHIETGKFVRQDLLEKVTEVLDRYTDIDTCLLTKEYFELPKCLRNLHKNLRQVIQILSKIEELPSISTNSEVTKRLEHPDTTELIEWIDGASRGSGNR
ncbi:MAG: hypothetical protein AAFY72_03525 [Cyanobacteria bacterium J06649_4]